MLNQLSQNLSTLDQNSKRYEKQVLNVIRLKTLAKHLLELVLYIGAIVVLFSALTTSIWETIGLKALYEHFNGQKNIQLGLTIAYISIVLGLFLWVFRKLVKSSRYY
jgi:chromate transport protein ChrA